MTTCIESLVISLVIITQFKLNDKNYAEASITSSRWRTVKTWCDKSGLLLEFNEDKSRREIRGMVKQNPEHLTNHGGKFLGVKKRNERGSTDSEKKASTSSRTSKKTRIHSKQDDQYTADQ